MNALDSVKLLRQVAKVPGVTCVALVADGSVESLWPEQTPHDGLLRASSGAIGDMVDGFRLFESDPKQIYLQLDGVDLVIEPMGERCVVVAADGRLNRSLLDVTLSMLRRRIAATEDAASLPHDTVALP